MKIKCLCAKVMTFEADEVRMAKRGGAYQCRSCGRTIDYNFIINNEVGKCANKKELREVLVGIVKFEQLIGPGMKDLRKKVMELLTEQTVSYRNSGIGKVTDKLKEVASIEEATCEADAESQFFKWLNEGHEDTPPKEKKKRSKKSPKGGLKPENEKPRGKATKAKKEKKEKAPSAYGTAVAIMCKDPSIDKKTLNERCAEAGIDPEKGKNALTTAYSAVRGIVAQLRENGLME